MVAKIIAYTLTCVQDEVTVKTGDTNAGVNAYTVSDTLKKVKAEALVYTQHHKFPQVQAKNVRDTLTGLNRK